ncbi:MAG: YfhO family protein, partial [Oscillospiraceae bacterium]
FEYFDSQNGYNIYKNQHFVPMGVMFDELINPYEFEEKINTAADKVLLKGMLLSKEDYKKYNSILPTVKINELLDATDETYFADCDKLSKNAVSSFSYDGNGFTAKVNAKKENLVFFSVPFDDGFTAKVNGKKAEIIKANVGFMAVKVPKGESNIEFSYKTPGLKTGIIVTILTSLILGLYLLIVFYLRKKKKIDKYNKFAHLHNENFEIEVSSKDEYIKLISKIK